VPVPLLKWDEAKQERGRDSLVLKMEQESRLVNLCMSKWICLDFTSELEVRFSSTPDKFELQPAFPNPFSAGGGSAYGGNPETTIRYSLPKTGDVSLKVYDLSGREVAILAEGHRSAGEYQLTWNASNLTSATYLVVLRTGAEMQVQKVVLLK